MKTLRVGKMPGQINEVVVELGTTVKEVLELVNLEVEGHDIKIDGESATLDRVIGENDNLIVLAKQVKGNASGLVRVGKMPGQINEFAVQEGTSVRELLELAGLSSEGHDIKVDGENAQLDDIIGEDTNLVVLAKQVKGNK